MKLGKIFICINILVLSLLMLQIYNRTIVLDGGHSYDKSFAIGEKYAVAI